MPKADAMSYRSSYAVNLQLALEVLADGSRRLDLKRLEAAILREYVKEGKVV